MPNGLAVEADGPDLGPGERSALEYAGDRRRATVHQSIGRQLAAMDLVRTGACQRVELGAERRREADVRGRDSLRSARQIGNDAIDAIDARSGHEADVVLRRHAVADMLPPNGGRALPARSRYSPPASTMPCESASSSASGATPSAYAAR